MKVALWVANRHRPFSIIEDTELLEIFTDLNPNCESPKHHTVSRDVKEIFGLSRGEVATMLQVGHIAQVDWSTISSYLTLACRGTQEGFMLPLMDGHRPTLSRLLERPSIGSRTARSHRLSLTSSSNFLPSLCCRLLILYSQGHEGSHRRLSSGAHCRMFA
jgi:hypothetical protein